MSRLLILFCMLGGLVVMSQPAAGEAITVHEDAELVPGMKRGPFVRLGGGELLTVEGRAALISADEGRTWQSYPIFEGSEGITVGLHDIVRTDEGVVVVAFMSPEGRKWTWSDELHDAPGARLPTYAVRSTDDGRTWEKPQLLHEEWTGAVQNMLVTKDGEIVFSTMMMLHDPGRHAVLTYTSADAGVSWERSNILDLGGAGHHGGVTEATIGELRDGRLLMLLRTNWGQLWRAESTNGGRAWHPYGPSGIPASSAPAMLARLASGRLVLVWNRPHPEGQDTYRKIGGDRLWSAVPVSNHRAELSMAFSDDEAKTWSDPVVIARVPDGKQLAYPRIFERVPGELWITTGYGGLRLKLHEKDFVPAASE